MFCITVSVSCARSCIKQNPAPSKIKSKLSFYIFFCVFETLWRSNLLRVLTTGLTSLTRLGLDEQVDEEKARKEGSEKDGKVGTELNLKGNSVRGHGLDDGVHGKGRGGDGGSRDGSGGGLGKVEVGGGCGETKKK